jgi:ATP adenylyltransferase
VTAASSVEQSACIFCDALARIETEPLVVFRGQVSFVIVNKFPYNNGHLMVVPGRHVPRLADLSSAELVEFIQVTQLAERVLTEVYNPQGLNLGLNLGKAAGAGVLDHLHMHIVPRWSGDTNFMSVVGETRVLPEELPATAQRLRAAFTATAAR